MISELSIIVPVYNEEDRVINGLSSLTTFCRRYIKRWEIIIVDDGSTDLTRYKILSHSNIYNNTILHSYAPNKGKGRAVKEGIMLASFDNILFTDIDLSTPITEVFKLFTYIRHYDVIIGSRNLPNSDVKPQSFIRNFLGMGFAILVNQKFGLSIADTQCGFKLFKKSAALSCVARQECDGWAFDVELLYIAKRLGLKTKEVGVKWDNDERSKLRWNAPFKMFKELKEIKENHG